ncbi:hypothetical protein MYMAC_007196 [Corallococcus macrosporus DSM 14697]|uniref:Uncharacterized protein n=1 Tax=Corallococcus macrosporus DSM 14697 TaxID=1189310 RepID=A0A286SGP3_9BACT|nr:hypothetical protein MYMAC_007196 [Corallococcus macrosporus DSM 14697]
MLAPTAASSRVAVAVVPQVMNVRSTWNAGAVPGLTRVRGASPVPSGTLAAASSRVVVAVCPRARKRQFHVEREHGVGAPAGSRCIASSTWSPGRCFIAGRRGGGPAVHERQFHVEREHGVGAPAGSRCITSSTWNAGAVLAPTAASSRVVVAVVPRARKRQFHVEREHGVGAPACSRCIASSTWSPGRCFIAGCRGGVPACSRCIASSTWNASTVLARPACSPRIASFMRGARYGFIGHGRGGVPARSRTPPPCEPKQRCRGPSVLVVHRQLDTGRQPPLHHGWPRQEPACSRTPASCGPKHRCLRCFFAAAGDAGPHARSSGAVMRKGTS